MFFLFHRNLQSLFPILLSQFLSPVWICFAREIGGKAAHDWGNSELESHTKANAVLSTSAPDVGLMEGKRFNTGFMTVLDSAAGEIWYRICALWVEVGPEEVCAVRPLGQQPPRFSWQWLLMVMTSSLQCHCLGKKKQPCWFWENIFVKSVNNHDKEKFKS